MLMSCMLATFFNEIDLLKKGCHPMDREKRVVNLIKNHGIDIHFRAGMEHGTALIGPLGNRKRKIVTAIGKAVDTASRLESSGIKNFIHITERILKILENTVVSKDTPRILDIAFVKKNSEGLGTMECLPFFEFYKNWFNLENRVVQKRFHISYKEFSQEITYLIQCMPTSCD
jgi:hypothetical protein